MACSEINSTLRRGSAGNCALERAARASIAHAVSNPRLRRRERSIVLGRDPALLVAGSRALKGRMESVSGVGMPLFYSVSLILVWWHEISGFNAGFVE